LSLPATDPSPTQNGSSVANFELYSAFWIGLALCDPNSNPFGPCTPVSDANNSATAGAAFLELQFYPPGSPFGSLPSASRPRKRRGVELGLSRLVGRVEDPPPVGRELRCQLVELRREKRKRFAIAEERQDPDVGFRRGGSCESLVRKIASVRRPRLRADVAAALQKRLLSPAAARRLRDDPREKSFLDPREGDPGSVRRPDRTLRWTGAETEPRPGIADEVDSFTRPERVRRRRRDLRSTRGRARRSRRDAGRRDSRRRRG